MPQASPAAEPLAQAGKLLVGQRDDRQPSLPHERRVGEDSISFDLGERHSSRQRTNCLDVNDHLLRVTRTRVGICRPRHASEPDDRFLFAGMIDERVVAASHRGEVRERNRIAHAIPRCSLLAEQVVPTVGGRFGLEEPMTRHGQDSE